MTEKEAIVFLGAIKRGLHQTGKDHPYRDDLIPKMKEALCIAIEEMKAESCTDAISREDAMSMILHFGNEIRHEVMDDIKASMIKLPSVTPKQKTGEWIKLKDHKPEAYEDVLVKDIDGDVTCAYLCDDIDFLERFSGEIIDDVV